jgi:glycerophosphoryl diester phosphodiesterase
MTSLIRLDAGAWKGPAWSGEQIPTLQQALVLVSRSATGLSLELKAPALYRGTVPDIVVAHRATWATPRSSVVASSSHSTSWTRCTGTWMECLAWTVNRTYAMRRALDIGFDGIITNEPLKLSDALTRRSDQLGASRWATRLPG